MADQSMTGRAGRIQHSVTERFVPAGSQENPWGPGSIGMKPGDFFKGNREGMFGFDKPTQLPGGFDENVVRGNVQQLKGHPMYPFQAPGSGQPDPYGQHREYLRTWEGVQNNSDFNAGPRVAFQEPEWMNSGFSGKASTAESEGMYGA